MTHEESCAYYILNAYRVYTIVLITRYFQLSAGQPDLADLAAGQI